MIRSLICLATGLALLASAPPARAAAGSAGAESLGALEKQVQEAVKKVLPAVVAVPTALSGPLAKNYEPFATGVVISEDGLILSQFHVSHLTSPTDLTRSLKPGTRVKVLRHDGREAEAELLGADRTFDLSLLRLVKPGPYPHVTLDKDVLVRPGDRVLEFGHPLGYRRGRAPVVRLGTVLATQADSFTTDCYSSVGDSGGPFVDLSGRLVGIIRDSGITDALRVARAKARHANTFLMSATPSPVIASRLGAMRRSEMGAFDEARRKTLGFSAEEKLLPVERWTQGASTAAPYGDAAGAARSATVAVLDDGTAVAQRTVVGADGWVLTKAGALPAAPTCRLPDGRVVPAEVVGADPAFDVALLRMKAEGLPTAAWAEEREAGAGTFLAAPLAGEALPVVGVVSVSRRDLPGPYPEKTTPPFRFRAVAPEVLGNPVPGRGFWVERRRRLATASKEGGGLAHLFSPGEAESRYVYDGARCFVGFGEDWVPQDAARFFAPYISYLDGLGLRPLSPKVDARQGRWQRRSWFPDNFELCDKSRVRPREEFVDGGACVVLEAEWAAESRDKPLRVAEAIWFDPSLGFAPRKWERRIDGVLQEEWRNRQFEEVAPGCWLPREQTLTQFAPPWAGPEHRDRPALAYSVRLFTARVNDVSDALFEAKK